MKRKHITENICIMTAIFLLSGCSMLPFSPDDGKNTGISDVRQQNEAGTADVSKAETRPEENASDTTENASQETVDPDDKYTTDDLEKGQAANGDEAFYGIWVSAYLNEDEAMDKAAELRDAGFDAYCIFSPQWENLNKKPFYCVTIGRSASEAQASSLLDKVKAAGYNEAYIKYSGNRTIK